MVTLITALGIAAIPGYTLMVRAQVKSIRSREYVWAEQVMGAKRAHIIFRHILPNCISPLIITTTSNLGSTILAEAGLSFLNLGVELPQGGLGQHGGRGLSVSAPGAHTVHPARPNDPGRGVFLQPGG